MGFGDVFLWDPFWAGPEKLPPRIGIKYYDVNSCDVTTVGSRHLLL